MQDFGFRPSDLLGIILKKGVIPAEGDQFDIDAADFGNSNAYCDGEDGNELNSRAPVTKEGEKSASNELHPPDWLFTLDKEVDLRMFFLRCENFIIKRDDFFNDCKVK